VLTAISSPDLHLLRVFVTVAEAGGFSRAQIALNVSQSTISTQMIGLETRLGMRLCRRGRAGFALTEEGREVYRIARELLRDCDNFVSRVNGIRGDISGDLRIATADSLLGNEDFPFDAILNRLRESMPAVSLHLSVMDPLEIERLVLEQRLHMGVHTFPNHAPGLRYIPLFSERQTLYCGKGHPLFGRKAVPDRGEVEQFDYACRSYYGGTLRPGSMKPKRQHVHSCNMEGIAASILSGGFIGHLPLQCARPWIEKGLMKPVLPEELSYDALFECVFPAGVRISRAQRILEDIVSGETGDTASRPRKSPSIRTNASLASV